MNGTMLYINVRPCQLSCCKHLNLTVLWTAAEISHLKGCRLTVKFCIETDSTTYTIGLLHVASVINAVPVRNTGHYAGTHHITRPFAAEQATSLLHNH